jgi:hypothetical protein
VVALRIARSRYRQFGAQLGVSHQPSFRDVAVALDRETNVNKVERLQEGL